VQFSCKNKHLKRYKTAYLYKNVKINLCCQAYFYHLYLKNIYNENPWWVNNKIPSAIYAYNVGANMVNLIPLHFTEG